MSTDKSPRGISVANVGPTCKHLSPDCNMEASLPTYFDPAHHHELPPKYGRWEISQEQAHLRPSSTRSIFDRQPVKFVALTVYLLLVYKILTADFPPSAPALNWTWPQDSNRAHSRDFTPFVDYEFSGEDDGWSRSRLGKLGAYSPLLTLSEMNLFVEAEWEVEPIEASNVEDQEEDNEDSSNETIFIDTATDQPKLPLPLHMPSSLFKLSKDMFNQGMRYLPSQSNEPRLLQVYDLQP